MGVQRIALILTMILCFAIVTILEIGIVKASSDVSGIISSDITWTKANSPYSLTGNLLVANGVTLTVERGVTVNLNDRYIMVNGTLCAQGSDTEKIHFSSGEITFTQYSSDWNEQTDSGSVIDNANLDSTNVSISSASPKINSNSISKITISDSTILTDNTISQEITHSYLLNSPIISGNTILQGGSFTASGSIAVTDNIITGRFCIYDGSGVISNNTVSGNLTVSGSASVSNNVVSGSLEVSGSVVASNNTVSGNLLAGSSATVKNNTILDGVVVSSASFVTISNNRISGGISLSPWGNNKVNASIINNTISGGEIGVLLAPTSSIFLYASSRTDAIISGNVIFDFVTAGIQVNGPGITQGGYYPVYNTAIIEENIVINTNCGIDVTVREDVRNNIITYNEIGIYGGSLIEGNLIVNNTYGIMGGIEGMEIRNNTIVNNAIGIESPFATLVYNNIYNNSQYNVRFTSLSNANATYNWWGTTDTQAINQTIYDFKNDFYLGTVSFVPFLTEPNSSAPSIQTTIIPEFPSWTYLMIMLVAVIVVTVIYRHSIQKQNRQRKNL